MTDLGPIRAGSRTAAPASWRPRTRWRRSASARATAIACSNATSSWRRRRALPAARRDAGAHHRRRAASAGERPWSELARSMPAAGTARPYAGEPLPTLDEHRALLHRTTAALLNIEIKPTPGIESATGEVVAREAQRLWAGAAVPPLLTSFRPDALAARARRARRSCRARLLLDTLRAGWLDAAQALGCVAVVCEPRADATPRWSAQCTAPGCARLCYTVNDAATAQRADRPRHRRHHHRCRRSLPGRARLSAPAAQPASIDGRTVASAPSSRPRPRASAAPSRRGSPGAAPPRRRAAARRRRRRPSAARRPTCSPSQPPSSAPGPPAAGSASAWCWSCARAAAAGVTAWRSARKLMKISTAPTPKQHQHQREGGDAPGVAPAPPPASSQPAPQTAKPSTRLRPGADARATADCRSCSPSTVPTPRPT